MVTRAALLALLLVGCTEIRYVTVPMVLPPPPPRVYGEALTDAEWQAIPDPIQKKLQAGLKLHRDREEIMETAICRHRPKPCP